MSTYEIHKPADVSVSGFTIDRIQTLAVWLMFASTFVVLIEPAPCDLLFFVAVACFLGSGLSFNIVIAPLIFFLLLYNLGALTSYLQFPADSVAQAFVYTTFYMGASAIFVAAYVSTKTLQRVALIRNAYILAAVIASLFAIAGYLSLFGFVGGLVDYTKEGGTYNRAVGLFKDPNVYSTYILLPAIFLTQSFMLGTQQKKLLSACGLVVILIGLFLAFSRGAWVNFLMATAILVVFSYILTPSKNLQYRIVLFLVAGSGFAIVVLGGLLTNEKIRLIISDRFTLLKSYDAGETGRFANQVNSIPLLLQRPLGFGPMHFTDFFTNAPHNTFINAFSAYGWQGGISYFVLIVLTLVIGIRTMFIPSPWQHYAIAVFAVLASTIFQGIQIDTDHWRHFYWLLGLMWGLFAASLEHLNTAKVSNRGALKAKPVEMVV